MSRRKFKKNNFSRFNKPSSMLVAKRALRKVKKLERKVEVKIQDSGIVTQTPALAGILTHINGIAQGDGVSERDGISCNLIGFKMNYRVQLNAASTLAIIRVIVVRDNRQVESTDPSVLDVLLSASVISQHSRLNPKRFTFYYDKVHALDDSSQRNIYRTFFRKAKFKMQFIGAAATTQTMNGLYLILISDQAGNLPSVQFSFRNWFVDM